MTPDATAELDRFERDLRSRLRSLPDHDVDDIAAELRSHVRDVVGGDGDRAAAQAALDRLGGVDDLAEQFTTARLLDRAGRSHSPLLVFRVLLRAASVSVLGTAALGGLCVGYALSLSLATAAIVKPLAPARVGLFRLSGDEYSLRLGLGASPPPQAPELLGWWLIPLGLIAAGAAVFVTTWLGRVGARRVRQSFGPL